MLREFRDDSNGDGSNGVGLAFIMRGVGPRGSLNGPVGHEKLDTRLGLDDRGLNFINSGGLSSMQNNCGLVGLELSGMLSRGPQMGNDLKMSNGQNQQKKSP